MRATSEDSETALSELNKVSMESLRVYVSTVLQQPFDSQPTHERYILAPFITFFQS